MARNIPILFLAALAQVSLAASRFVGRAPPQAPTILLDNGTFIGVSEGDVSVFRGIPYAQPPCVVLSFGVRTPS